MTFKLAAANCFGLAKRSAIRFTLGAEPVLSEAEGAQPATVSMPPAAQAIILWFGQGAGTGAEPSRALRPSRSI